MTSPLHRLPGLVGGRDPRSWYEVQELDRATYVIAEPRYWQRNLNYLLLGSEQALLVDTGSGLSDLSVVVRVLTDRPVTVVATHLHWDHTGCHHRFADVAAPDLPSVRKAVRHGRLDPPLRSRLAPRNRRPAVTTWLSPGRGIDLGNRTLALHHAPGHTGDSIVLHDPDRGLLLTGDLLYDGPVTFGLLPGSSLAHAAQTVEQLARDCPSRLVLGGHYGVLDGTRLPAFSEALKAVRDNAHSRHRLLPSRYRIDGFNIVLGPTRRTDGSEPNRRGQRSSDRPDAEPTAHVRALPALPPADELRLSR